MDPFASLSLDQLAQVLAHVNIKTRLSTCSLVSSTWRAAAASATTAIAVTKCSDEFVDWLESHTAAVQVTSISLVECPSSGQVVLPLAQLRSLQSLELDLGPDGWLPGPLAPRASSCGSSSSSSSSSSRPGGLEQLTALTQLKLTGCSVQLDGLSALTGLRELACDGVDFGKAFQSGGRGAQLNCIFAMSLQEDQLVAAFPRLQRLTSLRLQDTIGSAAVLAHISALRSLQQLELARSMADFPAAELPQSLTRLHFASRARRAMDPTNAANLSRLTALQSLHLQGVRPLDTALLRSMTRLRELRLTGVEHAPGSQRLAVVSVLSALTALTLDGFGSLFNVSRYAGLFTPPDPPIIITAAEAAALTTSPHLASLTLSGTQPLTPSDWADVFPAGRQLHSLTQLTLSADFLASPDTVRQVGRCAPNLQQVEFDRSQCYEQPPEEGEQQGRLARLVGEGVAALAGWPRLCKLSLRGPWPTVPSSVWQALGALSQITSLFLLLPDEEPSHSDVLRLEGCTSLRRLDIHYGLWRVLRLRSTAAPGHPPNVWQRLADELRR